MFSEILLEKQIHRYLKLKYNSYKHLHCICYRAYLRLSFSSPWAWWKPYEYQGKCFHRVGLYALDQTQKFHS